jgi:hypothetical protein
VAPHGDDLARQTGLVRLCWPKVPRALRREGDVPTELCLRSLSRGWISSRPESREVRERERQLERMVTVRPHRDNPVRTHVTLMTPASRFLLIPQCRRLGSLGASAQKRSLPRIQHRAPMQHNATARSSMAWIRTRRSAPIAFQTIHRSPRSKPPPRPRRRRAHSRWTRFYLANGGTEEHWRRARRPGIAARRRSASGDVVLPRRLRFPTLATAVPFSPRSRTRRQVAPLSPPIRS